MQVAGQGRGQAGSAPGWQSVHSRVRLLVVALTGVLVAVITGLFWSWSFAPLLGWAVAAIAFSAWTWLSIGSMDAAQTSTHATRDDPGTAQSDLIVVLAAVASLAGIGLALASASSETGAQKVLVALLAVASVALSWFTVHTLYTLRYARLYYTGSAGGVDFNQKSPPPKYLDFAYLAFTIGMTYQVSDTELQTPAIRGTALRHALLSYLFGAVILATTINLIAGLAGGNG